VRLTPLAFCLVLVAGWSSVPFFPSAPADRSGHASSGSFLGSSLWRRRSPFPRYPSPKQTGLDKKESTHHPRSYQPSFASVPNGLVQGTNLLLAWQEGGGSRRSLALLQRGWLGPATLSSTVSLMSLFMLGWMVSDTMT